MLVKPTARRAEQSLKDALAGESQANRRYRYFAANADGERFNDFSAMFRSFAEGETGNGRGQLDYLEAPDGPPIGLPIGARPTS